MRRRGHPGPGSARERTRPGRCRDLSEDVRVPPPPETTAAPPRRITPAAVAPAAALVLVALCLRGPFAAVGPVLDELGSELALSTGELAVVTALPLLCFGLLAPVAPVLAARIGLHRAAVAATAVLLVGVGLGAGGVARA